MGIKSSNPLSSFCSPILHPLTAETPGQPRSGMDSVCETPTSAGPWAQWHWHHIIKDTLACRKQGHGHPAPGGKAPRTWLEASLPAHPNPGHRASAGAGAGQHEGLLPSKTGTSFGKSSDTPLNISSSAVPLESPFPNSQGSASAPVQESCWALGFKAGPPSIRHSSGLRSKCHVSTARLFYK